MRTSLEKRVETLEKTSPDIPGVTSILVFQFPEAGRELTHIHDGFGRRWERLISETESQFQDRVDAEVRRTGKPIPLLFGDTSDMGQWRGSCQATP